MRSNRRKYPQDALRWVMGVFLAAVIASAATSAVFLTARRDPAPPDPRQQKLASARQIVDAIEGELETVARSTTEQANANLPTSVTVVYRTGGLAQTAPAANTTVVGDMPLVDPEDNLLMRGASTPWTLHVTTAQAQRAFARIVDIRESTSLSSPGYIGVVELRVETTSRDLAWSGNLPFEPPKGFQVVTSAEYTEMEESQKYQVRPASSVVDERTYQFANWAPTTAPPAELPELIQRQFNEAVVQCATAQPATTVDREQRTYFYSLREQKWTAQP